jgi:hypothetical protein
MPRAAKTVQCKKQQQEDRVGQQILSISLPQNIFHAPVFSLKMLMLH